MNNNHLRSKEIAKSCVIWICVTLIIVFAIMLLETTKPLWLLGLPPLCTLYNDLKYSDPPDKKRNPEHRPEQRKIEPAKIEQVRKV